MFAIHDVADMIALDLPWWSYRAIDVVEQLLADRAGQAAVFEYGSGASTAWLSRRSGHVTSVEHDANFADFLRPLLPTGSEIELVAVPPQPAQQPATPSQRRGYGGLDFTRYVHTIDAAPSPFDLVVVDGRARVAGVRAALEHLTDNGVVLLDNADRDEYSAVLDDPSIRVSAYRGATPCLPYPTTTALLRPC